MPSLRSPTSREFEPLEFIGLHDTFGTSGEPDELAEYFHITAPYIAAAAMRAIARREALQ